MELTDRHLAPAALLRGRTNVSFEYEAGFAPATGMTLRRRIEYFSPSGSRTPDRQAHTVEPQTVKPILSNPDRQVHTVEPQAVKPKLYSLH